MYALLKCINPDENKSRWYHVEVGSSLLDATAVACHWGNLRNAYQQSSLTPAANEEEAIAAALAIIEAKLQGGYELIESTFPAN